MRGVRGWLAARPPQPARRETSIPEAAGERALMVPAAPAPETDPTAAPHGSAVARLRALIPGRHPAHPPPRSLNEIHDEQLTAGERIADRFAAVMGSWPFIIVQSVLLVMWVALNAIAWFHHWDPYPFILLNLALSFQAAYAAPIIMMSQNRQADKDRLAAQHDFEINVKAEAEICALMDHLEAQHEMILAILERLERHEAMVMQLLSERRELPSDGSQAVG
jgi:uncharacterized membrane protein